MNSTFHIQNSKQPKGFTLIELLVVIATIFLLAGMLYPALRSIKDGPKKLKAKADCQRLVTAIQAYYNEYGKWPDTNNGAPAPTDEDFYTMLNGNVNPNTGAAAGAGSYALTYNPRGVRFMEIEKKDTLYQGLNDGGLLLDPWGTPYIILMDNGQNSIGYANAHAAISANAPVGGWWRDYSGGDVTSAPADGLIRNRYNNNYEMNVQIAVYSFGPNKTDDLAQGPSFDDISSWY